jgi:hypothetical protein
VPAPGNSGAAAAAAAGAAAAGWFSIGYSPLHIGKKTGFLRCRLYIKTNILPRQARDKHRESETQKKPVLSGWLLHIAEHLCRQIPRGGGGGGGGGSSSSSSSENPAAADADGAPKPARYGNATLFATPFDTKNAFILPRQARDKSGESSTQKREVIDACFDLQGETLG